MAVTREEVMRELARRELAKRQRPVSQPQAQVSQPQDTSDGFLQGVSSAVEQLARGGRKSLFDSAVGAVNLAQSGLERIGVDTGPIKASTVRDIAGLIPDESLPPQLRGLGKSPQGGLETTGKVATDIAQFMAPGSGLAKIGATARGLRFFSLGNVKALGLRGVAEGLTGAGISAVQQGEFDNTAKTVGVISAVFPAALEAIRRPVAAASKVIGDKILQRTVFKPQARDFRNGFNIQTLSREGIEGSTPAAIIDGVKNRISQIKDQIQPLLQGEKTVNAMELINRVLRETGKIAKRDVAKSRQISSSVNQFVRNILNNATPESQISAAVTGPRPSALNVNQLDNIRASFGDIANFNVLGETPSITAKKEVAKVIWRESKNLLEETVTNGKQLNALRKRLSKLIPLIEAGMRNQRTPSNNLTVGLIDSIYAAGGLVSGVNQGSIIDPRFLAAIAINHAQRSPFIANLFRRASRVLENPQTVQNLLTDFVSASAKVGTQEISREDRQGIQASQNPSQ